MNGFSFFLFFMERLDRRNNSNPDVMDEDGCKMEGLKEVRDREKN